MDEVAENSDEFMERYLEGEEISHDEMVTVLKQGVTGGRLFPVTCGVSTRNLGTNRLLEALVEDLPSPAMRGAVTAGGADDEEIAIEPDPDGDLVAYVFKTLADPYAGRINLLRVLRGAEERLPGQQCGAAREGADRPALGAARQGDGADRRARSRRHRRRREAEGDPCRRRAGDEDFVIQFPPLDLPAPVMAFAFEPKTKGDEEKAAAAVRRLEEEDPTLDVHRDPQTASRSSRG